jgi:hypothetical protein
VKGKNTMKNKLMEQNYGQNGNDENRLSEEAKNVLHELAIEWVRVTKLFRPLRDKYGLTFEDLEKYIDENYEMLSNARNNLTILNIKN